MSERPRYCRGPRRPDPANAHVDLGAGRTTVVEVNPDGPSRQGGSSLGMPRDDDAADVLARLADLGGPHQVRCGDSAD
jgi:hypothetical protein